MSQPANYSMEKVLGFQRAFWTMLAVYGGLRSSERLENVQIIEGLKPEIVTLALIVIVILVIPRQMLRYAVESAYDRFGDSFFLYTSVLAPFDCAFGYGITQLVMAIPSLEVVKIGSLLFLSCVLLIVRRRVNVQLVALRAERLVHKKSGE